MTTINNIVIKSTIINYWYSLAYSKICSNLNLFWIVFFFFLILYNNRTLLILCIYDIVLLSNICRQFIIKMNEPCEILFEYYMSRFMITCLMKIYLSEWPSDKSYINNLREKILAWTRIRTWASSSTHWHYNH